MLDFLYIAVSWVLLRWHDLFVMLGFSEENGFGWALSIIFLVVTARLLLVRLFIKQVHYQRNMQKMQPKIQKIREKYKGDRAEMNRQMMAFQQQEGFNPLAGCLPIFLQIPVFLGLYHSLRHLANSAPICDIKGPLSGRKEELLNLYTFSSGETCDAAKAKIFGDVPLAASFNDAAEKVAKLGGDLTSTRFVILPLLLISAGAALLTQLMIRRNATVQPEGTAATIQKAMLYLIPAGVLGSGLLFPFPLGVLLYWFTTNLWTLGQQAFIIRFHPQIEEPAVPVGEVGKSLAPKPGQRPVRMAKGKPAGPAKAAPVQLADDESAARKPAKGKPGGGSAGGKSGVNVSKSSAIDVDKESAADAPLAARGNVPRPGQRPNRSNGKRPPAKRPTQAKKRR